MSGGLLHSQKFLVHPWSISWIVASDPHGDGGWLLDGTDDSGVTVI